MPGGLGPTFTTQPFNNAATFLPADATTPKTVFGPANGPCRIFAILLTNSDASARVADVFRRVGSTNFLIGSVSVPAGTGVGGTAPKEFFESLNLTNLPGLDLSGTEILQVGMESTVVTPGVVGVQVIAGVY